MSFMVQPTHPFKVTCVCVWTSPAFGSLCFREKRSLCRLLNCTLISLSHIRISKWLGIFVRHRIDASKTFSPHVFSHDKSKIVSQVEFRLRCFHSKYFFMSQTNSTELGTFKHITESNVSWSARYAIAWDFRDVKCVATNCVLTWGKMYEIHTHALHLPTLCSSTADVERPSDCLQPFAVKWMQLP